MTKIQLYDTTLRDGTQREGVSLSARDKITIAQRLDRLGSVQMVLGDDDDGVHICPAEMIQRGTGIRDSELL